MVTKLSDLAHVIEQGSVPEWILKQIEQHKAEIEAGVEVVLTGPNGETFNIKAQQPRAVAA